MDFSVMLLTLGTQVVKSTCRLWLGDGFAGDMSDTVTDLLRDQVQDAIERQKLQGMFNEFAVTVADKARRAGESRSRSLPENERVAAVQDVAETFERAELNSLTLFAVNLDARALEKHLRVYVDTRISAWALSEQAAGYFDFLLRECCSYLLEIKKTLPPFSSEALTELLRRSSAIERQLAEVLERLPVRTSMLGDEGFETDYRRQVASELDNMNLFGASVFERIHGYRLSVAYISLLLADTDASAARQVHGVPVEAVLAASPRAFIRGEAGSGKTTLLQWIAISAARREFPEPLSAWNALVPFFIRLRQFADGRRFPRPEEFIRDGAGATLAAEMPDQWVHRVLKAGRGIVLVDGVDEVPRDKRPPIMEWLRRLIAAFPDSRFVVTSRPAATDEGWLGQQGFRSCLVQPMTLADVERFIAHWHRAMALTVVENAAKQELADLGRVLSDQVSAKRYLRQLATNPLLCALLCALNRERRAELPTNRIELFRISLEMFLQRRDNERQLDSTVARMEYDDKLQLLQDLAYWMMTNSLATAERSRVTHLVDGLLAQRRHRVTAMTREVLEYFLERSGVIREPIVGWIDFIHRSFQEYLAAQAAVDRDEIEALIERAADEQWRQVVILAAGLGNKRQTRDIFELLLNPPRKLRAHRMALELTALGCLETANEVDPALAGRIMQSAGSLIPPRSPEHVLVLSQVGEYAYDLLADVRVEDDATLRYMAEVGRMLGGSLGLKLLGKLSDSIALATPRLDEKAFTATLLQLWPEFDPIEFADQLLSRRDVPNFTVGDARIVPGLARVPSITYLACDLGPGHSDYTVLAKMPKLARAVIKVAADHQGLSLALPSRQCEVVLQPWASVVTAPVSAGRTLTLSEVDAQSILHSLVLDGSVEKIVIDNDDRIADLRGLRLPASVVSLHLIGCRSFSSLEGAGNLVGGSLERLEVRIARLESSFQQATEPLFSHRTPDYHRYLIDKLRYLYVSCPADARGIEVDAFVAQLRKRRFDVKLTRPLGYVITARR